MAEPGPGSAGLTGADPRPGRLSWQDYSARWATLHGGVDPRRSSTAIRSWLRLGYVIGRGLALTGVSADAITAAGLLASLAVPIMVLFGGAFLVLAALLVLASALADTVDGAVAVITSRTSRLGGFYDAVADRISEAAWLLALWLYGVPGILVVACGALAWLHEYARARAAASGMGEVGAVTVAERPTRVILMIVALVLGGLASFISTRLAAGAMTVVVAVWLVLGVLGAARLLRAIQSALRTPTP